MLHTWTQDLRRHPHVHALMACGALQPGRDGAAPAWVKSQRSERFLFPVHALSEVFRSKFIQALEHAERSGAPPRDPACTLAARQQRTQALHAHAWVVSGARHIFTGPGLASCRWCRLSSNVRRRKDPGAIDSST